jgi:hypothetical protein
MFSLKEGAIKMIGFETIGNATVICYDDKPILSTDPWISGDAYFGSWFLPYEIPKEQYENIIKSEFIWVSHGHPDHLSGSSLDKLTNSKFLLSDHVGRRIYDGFIEKGLNVQILPDRKWTQLSKNIKVMGVSDYFQDSILLIDINGRLLVNLNDAGPRGTTSFLKKIIENYKKSILLKLFGYGDVTMLNCYNEDGSYIKPTAAYNKEEGAVGPQIKFWAELYGVTGVVPFSCFHDYQRTDSIWAREITTPLDQFYNDFDSNVDLLPFYIRYNCETDDFDKIKVEKVIFEPKDPKLFGDDWSEQLSASEVLSLEKYFKQYEALNDFVDYIQFKVGGENHVIEFSKTGFNKGLQFETPRGSLMTCVNYEIFDDLLIGNFMKTTYLGDWRTKNLELVDPYVAKYGDNGLAKTKEELRNYFYEYTKRAPLELITHLLAYKSEQVFRSFVSNQSPLFRYSKKVYSYVR